MTYHQKYAHIVSFGLISLLFITAGFYSQPTSASVISAPTTNNTNSQRVSLLTSNYSVEIPKAIGGPTDIAINNKLALMTPRVGITNSVIESDTIEINTDGMITYIIQEGDTLSEIAEKFNISINTIKWENNIGNKLTVGKEISILAVAGEPVSGIRHTITQGDTLGKIAEMYEVEVEDVTIFNDIDAKKLTPGKKIIIPNGTKRKVIKTKITTTSKNSSKISTKSSGSGYYIRPTSVRATSLFGPRWGKYHFGIDYGGPTGTPIVASASGKVTKIRNGCTNNGYIGNRCGGGYGNYMEITHENGTKTLYAHLSKIEVNLNTKVTQGQVIARMGNSGNSTGPHLHFEIIEKNGKKRNVNFLK